MNSAKNLRLHAIGLLVGYVLQFLVGMSLNLFVMLPKTHPGTQGSDYFIRSSHSLIWALSGGGGVALVIHTYIALALCAAAIALITQGLKTHYKKWVWIGGVAAFFTLGALFNGLSFVDYSKNYSSMIMASCWLIAVSALVIGLIRPEKAVSS